MPDDHKKPEKKPDLKKIFGDFSFDADDAAPTKAPAPYESDTPRKLTKDDMNFEPYRGMKSGGGRRIPVTGDDGDDDGTIDIRRQEEDLAWEEQRAWEEEQERVFEAAGTLFRKNRAVHKTLDLVSNLEIISVVTAGHIEQEFRGRLPDARVNDMMNAALVMRAGNFDDIAGKLTPYTVGMVDELRMMADTPDDDERLLHVMNLEPDSKRVLLANTIADLEMTLHEMHEYGDMGPDKEEHDRTALFIKAMSDGIEPSFVRRAVDMYNVISTATDNPTTLKVKGNEVVINPFPDIEVEPAKPRNMQAQRHKKPKGPGH